MRTNADSGELRVRARATAPLRAADEVRRLTPFEYDAMFPGKKVIPSHVRAAELIKQDIAEAASRGRRAEDPKARAAIYLDIDRFKEVNDEIGHLQADKVLIALVEALRATFRDEDLIARQGDEFLIWIAGRDVAELERILFVQRENGENHPGILETVQEKTAKKLGADSSYRGPIVNFSYGVAMRILEHGEDPGDVYEVMHGAAEASMKIQKNIRGVSR